MHVMGCGFNIDLPVSIFNINTTNAHEFLTPCMFTRLLDLRRYQQRTHLTFISNALHLFSEVARGFDIPGRTIYTASNKTRTDPDACMISRGIKEGLPLVE